MRRLLRIAAIVAASLAVIFLILSAAAYFLVDPGALANRELSAQLPSLEKKLGRKVTVGGVSASFLPLSAALHDVEVGDADTVPEDRRRPLLKARTIGVRVALLDALLSLGKKVRVTDVTL